MKLKNSIKIIKRLTAGDVVVDYSFLKNYKVRVFDDNGNPVGFGETVSITFNGKIFCVQTNKYGYATFKISGLLPKTYTITSEYNGVKISNKITVKQVLKAKNAKYKRFKAKKYTATLKTSLGKAIKGKKIFFKIKGKTYTAKTNKNGVATIKIKGLYKLEKHKITIKYLKTSIKKTITIKR